MKRTKTSVHSRIVKECSLAVARNLRVEWKELVWGFNPNGNPAFLEYSAQQLAGFFEAPIRAGLNRARKAKP